MKYMLLMYAKESDAPNQTPEEYQAAAQAWNAFSKEGEAAGMARGAERGLEMLERLSGQADGYYPYHAARADLLRRTRQPEAAADAYAQALELCGNPAERAYLQRRLEEMHAL